MMNLYEHQKRALEQTADANRVAYYLDMGLGKTFVGSEKLDKLGAQMNLLICQNSKIADWKEHFQKYYEYKVLVLRNNTDFKEFIKLNESRNLKCIGIVNYELAWRRKMLLELHDFTLMLDESSLIQNSKAKQSKFVMKLNPQNVILLSGTPTSGRYENLWTQLKLLGYDISEKLYMSQYVNFKLQKFGSMYIRTVDIENPYKNVERLKGKMRAHGAIFMKTEECFELPEQNFIEVRVDKSKHYTKFMRSSYVVINEQEIVGDTTLTKHLRARQLCGQYSKEKLYAFKDLVESTKDRIVVFYNFNDELDILTNICKELKRTTAVFNGEKHEIEEYKRHEDCIIFCQYQAGAMGLNLQQGNKVIYFTLPERSELFEQSKKRIHRIGQTNTCFYYVMLCRNSIEEVIYDCLQKRKDFTDELFKEYVS